MDSLNQHVADVYKYLQNLDATFLHHNKDSDSAYIGLIFSLNRINIGLNLIDHSHNVRAKSNSVILATTLIMSSLLMIYLGNVGVFFGTIMLMQYSTNQRNSSNSYYQNPFYTKESNRKSDRNTKL